MAKSKETLAPCVRECRFIRKEPDETGKQIIYYFQTVEYLSELNFFLELDLILGNMTEEDIKSFKGNLKFKIGADLVGNSKYKSLIEAQPNQNLIIHYADSPQSLVGDRGGSVSFERVQFLGLYKSWADFYERELKVKGKVTFAAPANSAAAANRTTTTAGTGAS